VILDFFEKRRLFMFELARRKLTRTRPVPGSALISAAEFAESATLGLFHLMMRGAGKKMGSI
jgi:hypothetical protein